MGAAIAGEAADERTGIRHSAPLQSRWPLIAFISDRDGASNIWVMDPDGKNPRQVSKESRWFINSPTWSPDGRYIFSRKHFVKERSLGAGEIWMHHVSGAEGLQVTEKTSWQKDAGEPAISPDGKYLYYSKDVTPGQNFEYNKDPYGRSTPSSDAISRRGEKQIIGRPGGAIAPRRPRRQAARVRPPSGSRRAPCSSTISTTDEEWPVFDRLDNDLQEAWAIHGVYAQYAWLPDSSAIVIWGQGKIWRVDVVRKSAVEVPFTGDVEQTINAAVRFPQKVHPDEFPVRMLRDVTTSPDGKLVAYSALGKIYAKSLPDGEPARLTKERRQSGRSPRVRSRVLARMARGSSTRRGPTIASDGSASPARRQRRARAWSRHPAITPSRPSRPTARWSSIAGQQPTTFVASPHGANAGIYAVSLDGAGAPSLVREQGTDPQFDHTGKRVYFRERRGEKFILRERRSRRQRRGRALSVGERDADRPFA